MGLTLRQARKALGWSQQKLAEKAGVPQQTVSRLEHGQYLDASYQTVMRVVLALRKSGMAGLTAELLFPVRNGDAE